MSEKRLFRWLSRLVEIKPGEESISLLLFLYFFLITAPFGIIKPVRNTKFLIDLGSAKLPLAFLLTAVAMGFIVAFHSKLQVRIPRDLLINNSLYFFIITCFAFGLLFLRRFLWVPMAFWVWANIFVVVTMTQFWMLINDIFNPREAKRLIGFFVSGGILGGIFGHLLTGLLSTHIPDYLLFIACGMLITSVAVLNAIFIWQRKKSPASFQKEKKTGEAEGSKIGFKVCLNTVKSSYYLKLMAGAVTIALIVSTFIDWQYQAVIENKMDVDDYLTFFGYFEAGLLVLPFFLQLFLTSSIIKRYGIRFSLLIYPFILLLGFFGIAFFPRIVFASIIKGSDKSLDFSLNQSVRELLYIPISPEVKYKAKIFIDMFLNRFAKGIGALILLIILSLPVVTKIPPLISTTADQPVPNQARFQEQPIQVQEAGALEIDVWKIRVRYVSALSFALILAWIIISIKISREYTNTVKQRLDLKWERADRVVSEKLDVNFMKLVIDTLENKNRSSVLYAMDIFDLIKQDRLTPDVKRLISQKQDEMKATSLGSLIESGETGIIQESEEFLSEDILVKEIKEIMELDVYKEVMGEYFEKVMNKEDERSEVAKMEVARAIGLMSPQSPLIEKLDELLSDRSPDVVRYAMQSVSNLQKKIYIPALVKNLQNPQIREDARDALKSFGEKILGTLSDYIGDPAENLELRNNVAWLMGELASQEAADSLLVELVQDNGKIRTSLIDALDQIRAKNPSVVFSQQTIENELLKTIKQYYRDFFKLTSSKEPEKKIVYDISRVIAPFCMSTAERDAVAGAYLFETCLK